MAHWQYILWGLGGSAGFAAACRYIPRAFLVLMGGLTTSTQRFKQCAEMVRLLRKDAKEIPSYFTEPSESAPPPPTTVPPGLQAEAASRIISKKGPLPGQPRAEGHESPAIN
jgi:hypothetical protein